MNESKVAQLMVVERGPDSSATDTNLWVICCNILFLSGVWSLF